MRREIEQTPQGLGLPLHTNTKGGDHAVTTLLLIVSPVWAGEPAPTSVSHYLLNVNLFTVDNVDTTLLGFENSTAVEVEDHIFRLNLYFPIGHRAGLR